MRSFTSRFFVVCAAVLVADERGGTDRSRCARHRHRGRHDRRDSARRDGDGHAARTGRRHRRDGHGKRGRCRDRSWTKPGRYAIKAAFSGFDAGELGDVRLRAGDNKQQIELELTAFTDTVEVGLDPQSAAADPNNTLATS